MLKKGLSYFSPSYVRLNLVETNSPIFLFGANFSSDLIDSQVSHRTTWAILPWTTVIFSWFVFTSHLGRNNQKVSINYIYALLSPSFDCNCIAGVFSICLFVFLLLSIVLWNHIGWQMTNILIKENLLVKCTFALSFCINYENYLPEGI